MTAETAKQQDIVLVVDDTPESLSFLTDTLYGTGATVLVATDGETALSLVDQITPDLILMDALMPGIDGFETCRRLKREKQLAHVPVIFMTGLSETENILQGLDAGGVDYVTKPIVVEELLGRIRVHLANARILNGTRMALDATGRFLLSTHGNGRLRWCTPRAAQLLAELFPAMELPPAVTEHITRLRDDFAHGQRSSVLTIANRRLQLFYVGATGDDEFLFRLTDASSDRERQLDGEQSLCLQQNLGLTQRESEVLLWLSRGKNNRDISQILSISPRTVNKHLEQVFEKVGVENRSAAVARAVRYLSQWG